MEQDEPTKSLLSSALNIILIISGLSFLIYFSGYINFVSYYSRLGINSTFLDFEYSEYLINGAFVNLFIFIPFTLLFEHLFATYQLGIFKCQLKKHLTKITNINQNQEKAAKIYIENQKTIKLIDDNLKLITDIRTIVVKHVNSLLFVFITLLILCIVFVAVSIFLLKNIDWTYTSTMSGIQVFITILFIILSKNYGKNSNINVTFLTWTFITTILVYPGLSGYFEADVKVKTNYFRSYQLQTEDKNTSSGKLLYYGKGKYFFLIHEKLNIVPENRIIKIVKN